MKAINQNTVIDIIGKGIFSNGEDIIAMVGAYWKSVNMNGTEASFRFRSIPGVTIFSGTIIVGSMGRYQVIAANKKSLGSYGKSLLERRLQSLRVRVIKPIEKNSKQKKQKVCAYARVSTDSLKQEDSLENQTSTYKRIITSNPSYEYVGIYADQGISGYSENRPAFQSMIEKARAGEIDLIITKSVSRFARNTVTVLKVARELKELGVGIFFEEQNINTLSGDGEMMLTVLASFAQEESRSMSENTSGP